LDIKKTENSSKPEFQQNNQPPSRQGAHQDSHSSSVTMQEINGQPQLWLDIYTEVIKLQKPISDFLAKIKSEPNSEAIFMGAGSSAFVAESVSGIFQKSTGIPTRAVATTDMVTHPELTISKNRPTLFVSFARSGNSPESVAAVQIALKLNPQSYHLIITCNQNGELAKLANVTEHPAAQNIRAGRLLTIVLPDAANDRGLAMIGSVTGMILATLMIADINQPELLQNRVELISKTALSLISRMSTKLKEIAQLDFKRVVCLGSGPSLGLAREAHLKIQELSDGAVIGKFDSFLGFRHGPKAVVDSTTLMIYFLSHVPYVSQYDADLVRSTSTKKPMYSMSLSAQKTNIPVDLAVTLNLENSNLPEAWIMLAQLVPIQILAAFKSMALGLNPDSPSPTGAIHRVVQGVNIYPYSASIENSVDSSLDSSR
jgi:tagatose-6-phosphate ketose/aldose isomerase